jgi:diguanylate cyclase (GGDEF)-like protein
MINDLRGHISGGAVITQTAQAIRESIREGDERARLGGDEFIVFSPDCDTEGAVKIAEGTRARLSNQRMPLAGGKFSVSIVISVQDGTSADFTRMYQDADAAPYHAREDGKSGFGL